nr:hypothetical protein [Candidatus Anoxychlamydiales bacterium]
FIDFFMNNPKDVSNGKQKRKLKQLLKITDSAKEDKAFK